MVETETSPLPDRGTLIRRGFMECCPKCGQGRLYQSYLKPCAVCSACGEILSEIRADDGPAWLTIMVAGHLVMPLAIYLAMHDVVPGWAVLPLLLVLTLGLVLLILPRAKGIFIAMLWRLRQSKGSALSKYEKAAET